MKSDNIQSYMPLSSGIDNATALVDKSKGFAEMLEKVEKADAKSQTPEALKEVCKDFEAMFVNMMMKSMQKTVPEDSFIKKSQGTKIFESMYHEEISNSIADGGGFGLADMMYENLSVQYGIYQDDNKKLDIQG